MESQEKKKSKKLIKADNELVIAEAPGVRRNGCRLSQGTNFQS